MALKLLIQLKNFKQICFLTNRFVYQAEPGVGHGGVGVEYHGHGVSGGYEVTFECVTSAHCDVAAAGGIDELQEVVSARGVGFQGEVFQVQANGLQRKHTQVRS